MCSSSPAFWASTVPPPTADPVLWQAHPQRPGTASAWVPGDGGHTAPSKQVQTGIWLSDLLAALLGVIVIPPSGGVFILPAPVAELQRRNFAGLADSGSPGAVAAIAG